ncbi:MAG: hypothetical protein HWE26_14150 [Alteromonadaceae bacterium]|nr:hypothetical protein [Alteromonadaceae bacterium]
MTKTQIAIIPAMLTAFWFSKIGNFMGIDGIVLLLILISLVALSIYLDIRENVIC